MRKAIALLLGLLGIGCERNTDSLPPAVELPKSGIVVTCSPNPCDKHADPTVLEPSYRYMWSYRTEVRNTLDVPLRIVWFEAFTWHGSRWVPETIAGRTLTAKDFSEWYPDGDEIIDGVIPASGVAIDARNWHGSESPSRAPTKWADKATDPSGTEHYAEVVVESVPIKE